MPVAVSDESGARPPRDADALKAPRLPEAWFGMLHRKELLYLLCRIEMPMLAPCKRDVCSPASCRRKQTPFSHSVPVLRSVIAAGDIEARERTYGIKACSFASTATFKPMFKMMDLRYDQGECFSYKVEVIYTVELRSS